MKFLVVLLTLFIINNESQENLGCTAFPTTYNIPRKQQKRLIPSTNSVALSTQSNRFNGDISENRRQFLEVALLSGVLTLTNNVDRVNAATTSPTPEIGKLTVEEAEEKFIEGYKTIVYLLDNYDQICEGGGDNVRRYLGTIVSYPTPSPLVYLKKALKALEVRSDDFIEYTELSEEIVKSVDQASGSSYMAIFVTTSTSYTPPQKYFNDAKIEIKRCKASMENLAKMVDIKL